MKPITPSKEYLEKAKGMSGEDAERFMVGVRGRFGRRKEDKKLSKIEALALQLELEDEALAEWREKMLDIKVKHKDWFPCGYKPNQEIDAGNNR
jgi:hypothetical protein